MEKTFLTTTELFGSPLNYPMTNGLTYCSAFPDDDVHFGAILNSFRYRWTASCMANLEYEPEDMLQAVLHALASSEHTDAPFPRRHGARLSTQGVHAVQILAHATGLPYGQATHTSMHVYHGP